MYVRHSHNVDGWRACIHDLKNFYYGNFFQPYYRSFCRAKQCFFAQYSAKLPFPQSGLDCVRVFTE